MNFRSFLDQLLNSRDNDEKSIHHDKIQDEFINIASHEMKTPVQSILTYSELLHSNHNEIRTEYIDAIYRNALRLQNLSKNLLDITRIENQTLRLKNKNFDINELVSSVIQDFVRQISNSDIKTKNVRFLFSPKGHVLVHADKDRIAQVILNLIDNAFKFTQSGDILIDVNKQNDNDTVIISVNDSGIGVNTQIAPRLFSKFATSSENGIGLGLYISKNIIEAHDGKIWAQSNYNKVGTTFSFKIPSKMHMKGLVKYQRSRKFLNKENNTT